MNCILYLPDDEIDKLKCSICDNYLSHFPVTTLTEEDKNVCGRCSIPEGKVGFHNKIFEQVVQHVSFPCRFKKQGCNKQLLPSEMPSHESHCSHKLVKCPARDFVECSWEGARNSILLHCQEIHEDLFLKDKTFEINVSDSNALRRFLEYNGTWFEFSLNFDSVSNTLSFMAYHVQEEIVDVENYSFQIVLSRGTKKIIAENVTKTFSEREWCEIALDSLTKNNDDNKLMILGRVVFDTDIGDSSLIKLYMDKLTSSDLKCVCGSYVILPPIRIWNNGIKCHKCGKTKQVNFFFSNQIVEKLSYPCLNKRNGCEVVLKSEKMRKHVLLCPLQHMSCEMPNCSWYGLKKSFKDHALQNHQNMTIKNGKKFYLERKTGNFKCLISYSNHLFMFWFSKEQRPSNSNFFSYKWTVVAITSTEEFNYKIEFVHDIDNTRLLMQRKCLLLHEHEDKGRKPSCELIDNETLNFEIIGFNVCILK